MRAAEGKGQNKTLDVSAPFKLSKTKRSTWRWAGFTSILILAWFLWAVTPASVEAVLGRIETNILIISSACFAINGLLDAVWLRLITRPGHPRSGPVRVIAWHMLWASILPARIGEFAYIYLIHRWLDVPGARAVFIILYHRLQDFIVINLLMLLTILGVGFETENPHLVPIASTMLAVLLLIIWRLEISLSLGAAILTRAYRATGYAFLQTLLLHLLQVRTWYRHRLTASQLRWSFLVIVLRWAVVLPAIGIVLHAGVAALNWPHSLFVANVYLYSGIIPVQAVGGFGAGEAGLIWILTVYGLSIGTASALSLLIRLLINFVHISLWLLTVIILFFVTPDFRR